jgi:hypothetical protein
MRSAFLAAAGHVCYHGDRSLGSSLLRRAGIIGGDRTCINMIGPQAVVQVAASIVLPAWRDQ